MFDQDIDKAHDIDQLDRGAENLLRWLDSLTLQHDRVIELLKFWRQPGWTTPAEFAFTRAAVVTLGEQAASLNQGIENLHEAAGMVGR